MVVLSIFEALPFSVWTNYWNDKKVDAHRALLKQSPRKLEKTLGGHIIHRYKPLSTISYLLAYD